MLRCVSCKQQNSGSCCHFHSLNLCLFIGELGSLILSNINDQWFLTSVIFLVVVFVCFPSLSYVGGGLSEVCAIMCIVGVFVFGFPLVLSVRLGLFIFVFVLEYLVFSINGECEICWI